MRSRVRCCEFPIHMLSRLTIASNSFLETHRSRDRGVEKPRSSGRRRSRGRRKRQRSAGAFAFAVGAATGNAAAAFGAMAVDL